MHTRVLSWQAQLHECPGSCDPATLVDTYDRSTGPLVFAGLKRTGLFKLFLDSANGDKKAAAPGAIAGLHPASAQSYHTLTAVSGATLADTKTSLVFLPSPRLQYLNHKMAGIYLGFAESCGSKIKDLSILCGPVPCEAACQVKRPSNAILTLKFLCCFCANGVREADRTRRFERLKARRLGS